MPRPTMKLKHSLLIQWSDQDGAYLVTLPEFDGMLTHGDTYEEALRHGLELIEANHEWAAQEGAPVPPPATFALDAKDDIAQAILNLSRQATPVAGAA